MKHQKLAKRKRDYFQEYCNNTTLHGLKYVGERRTTVEKIVWCTLFLTAVGICTYMIIQTYKKWDNSPVIVSFAHNPTPIGAIPFPAVTICPQNKAKRSIFNFTDMYIKYKNNKLEDYEKTSYNRLKLVCDLMPAPVIQNTSNSLYFDNNERDFDYITDIDYYLNNLYDDMKDIDHMIRYSWEYSLNTTEEIKLILFLYEAAPTLDDIFESCTWNYENVECSKFFKPTINEDGICFTFNMLRAKDFFTDKVQLPEDLLINDSLPVPKANWNMEDGYIKKAKSFYPMKGIGAGVKYGLQLEMKTHEEDFDYICTTSIQGFKVILHEPSDIPKGKTQYIRIPIDQEVTIAVQPNIMTTSSNLRNYIPSKRKCYFKDERKLEFFQRYTQENCEMECLTKITLQKCKCVAFYMPRTNNTFICSSENQTCVNNVEKSFMKLSIKDGKEELPCNCMPACHSLQYQAEISQADYEWHKFETTMNEINKLHNEDIDKLQHKSKINIFFKEKQFISTERSELYGHIDFISNCGGIFGLFTGFSILSLFEILYYLSLRIWMNKKLFGKFCIKTPEEPAEINQNI